MNEQLQKDLEKNYGKVQKKELKLNEAFEKLEKALEKDLKSNQAAMKDELKGFVQTDKQIKDHHKEAKKDLMDKSKDFQKANKVKVTEANEATKKEEEKIKANYEKELEKLSKSKEKIEANYEKLVASVLKTFEKDIKDNQEEQDKVTEANNTQLGLLDEKSKEKEEKYNEKVKSLNEKREDKISRLNEAFAKKNEKLEEGIKKQREKSDNQISAYEPIFQEKIGEVEELITNEQNEYDTKLNDIKETLKSKLDRRNKFLEKAQNENDVKAAKIQRKEIKQLEVSAEREIKALDKAHQDRKADLSRKKLEVLKNNLEQAAAVEREFINFKEDNLMQIELNKVTVADEITKTKLDTELKLQDELAKHNDYMAKQNEKIAAEVKKGALKLEQQKDLAVKLQIQFELTNKENELSYVEELALNEKNVHIAELEFANNNKLNNFDQEITLAKLANEISIQEKNIEKELEINNRNAQIKYHESDNNKLASVKSEYTLNQEAFVSLYQKRAEELSDFEEVEILNRAALKVNFLEAQIKRVEDDLKSSITEIEKAYKQETDIYNMEVEKIASEDQKAVTLFKQTEEAAIQALVDTKKELDPKSAKGEIMELDAKIDTKKTAYRTELKQKEDFVFAKTQLFQANIELAELRKQKAIEESQEMAELERNDLTNAIEQVNNHKDIELAEAKARYDKTINNTTNFKNLATNRNQLTTEENQTYLTTRVNKENSEIDKQNQLFEEFRNEATNQLNALLQSLEDKKVDANNKLKADTLSKEAELEAKIEDFKEQLQRAQTKERNLLSEQADSLRNAEQEQNSIYNSKVNEIDTLLKQQEQTNLQEVQGIDKKQDVETKNFEAEQQRVQKEYELELKKGLASINQKLDQDVKAL